MNCTANLSEVQGRKESMSVARSVFIMAFCTRQGEQLRSHNDHWPGEPSRGWGEIPLGSPISIYIHTFPFFCGHGQSSVDPANPRLCANLRKNNKNLARENCIRDRMTVFRSLSFVIYCNRFDMGVGMSETVR